jgi:hypothetical protein
MKDRAMRRLLAAGMALAGTMILGAGWVSASRAQRSFVFTYEVHVPPAAAGTGESRLWIPLPQSDEHQSIGKLAIESRVAHELGKEAEYGNSYAVFAPQPAEAAAGYDVALRFEVTRREYLRELKGPGGQASRANDAMILKRYLEPDISNNVGSVKSFLNRPLHSLLRVVFLVLL